MYFNTRKLVLIWKIRAQRPEEFSPGIVHQRKQMKKKIMITYL